MRFEVKKKTEKTIIRSNLSVEKFVHNR